jgi:hypothetical protein
MIATLEILGPRTRVIVAWTMILAVIAIFAAPVIISVQMLAQSNAQVGELRRETVQLAERVDEQAGVISQWYLDHAQTPEDVVAYGDAERSQRQIEDQVDRLSEALIEAGIILTRSPVLSAVSLDDGVVELRGDIAFSGRMHDFVSAILVEEFSRMRVGELEIISVRGQAAGRVRGQFQVRQFYVVEGNDDA